LFFSLIPISARNRKNDDRKWRFYSKFKEFYI
jgi:hypothetical protein